MALIAHYKFNENTAGDNANKVVNGNFSAWTDDDPDGWIVDEAAPNREVSEVDSGQGHGGTNVTGGYCNLYTDSATSVSIYQDIATVIGRKYQVSIKIDKIIAGEAYCNELNTQWSNQIFTAETTYTWTFVATQTTIRPRIWRYGNPTDITIDDFSIKLLAVEDSSGNDHDGLAQQDTDQISAANTRGVGTCFDFNGTSDFIEIGDTSSDVKSIAMWVNPDSVTTRTDYPIDLNGTDYITIVNGTVTKNGFGSGTQIIYVDGVVASTVTANWHLVVLTSTVGFTADALDIGRVNGSGFFDGLVDSVILFDTILNEDQTKALYHGGHGTEIVEVIDLDRRIQRRQ